MLAVYEMRVLEGMALKFAVGEESGTAIKIIVANSLAIICSLNVQNKRSKNF